MELFKLFGTIGLKGVEQTEQDIRDVTDQAEDGSVKMESAFKKIGAAVATYLTIDTIKRFGQAVVQASAEVSAEVSAFEQIMGDYTDTAKQKMEEVADTTGVVDSRLIPYMTSMTAKFKGLGFDIDTATTFATDGLMLASDAAAFWDKSLDESMGHLNSFINGSYEGGEAIGLFANDTQMAAFAVSQGIVSEAKEWSNLDEAIKQATRMEYAKAMFEQSGAVGQAAKEAGQYANVQANLTEKWRQFKALVGEPILQNIVIPAMTALSGLVTGLTNGYQALTTWMKENETAVTLIGIAIGTLTAAIIAFNIQQNAATIAMKLHAAATAIATTATTAWGAVMAFVTSPVTLVIAAIGALIAIVVLLVKNWDTVKVKAQELWTNIQVIFGQIKDWITLKFQEAQAAVMNVWTSITTFLSGIWETIKNIITVGLMFIVELIKAWVSLVTLPFRFIWENCKGIIMKFVNAAKQLLTNWINNIVAKFNNLKAKAQAIMQNIRDSIMKIWNSIYSKVAAFAQNIYNSISSKFNSIKNKAVNIFNYIKDYITVVFNNIKNKVVNIWTDISGRISNAVESIRTRVTNTFDSVKTKVSNIFEGIRSTAANVWNRIKSAIETPIRNASTTVKNMIDKIKGFFNFNWSLPKLKMPHVNISGKFSLMPPSVPKFSIEWYKKAMDNPMILNGPTIFGSANGRLLGGGEAGAEVVAGRDTLMNMIQRAVDRSNARNNEIMEKILSLLATYIPEIAMKKTNLLLDTGVLVGEIAPGVDRKLGEISRMKERGR